MALVSVELLITVFLVIILVASLISIKAGLPYTIALVLVGIAITILSNMFLLGTGTLATTINEIRNYTVNLASGPNGGLFVGIVVPPLIFEAMMHIRSSDLKSVLRPAFTLATIGVVIATVAAGLLLWLIVGLPPYISFLFAAVISPTDTATVLEIFRRLRVPKRLATMLDTEAAFNDATGIVIFTIILAAITSAHLPVFSSMLSFVVVFGGGVAVGLVVAFLAELVSSFVSDRLTETILTIWAVYGSYTVATEFGLSGLIAVSVVGLYFGNYTINTSIRASNREAVRVFWEIAAFVGNSVAFLFIGFRTDLVIFSQSIGLILLSYIAVVAARAATVYPILTVFDRLSTSEENKIPLKWRNVAMLGGMKGALSIALAASITATAMVTQDDVNKISTLVLGVALISIILQTILLSRYIKRGFPKEKVEEREDLNVRLSRIILATENLRQLKEESKISNKEFANQLQQEKDELEDLLAEIDTEAGTEEIIKSRASDLYSSFAKFPSKTRANMNHMNHAKKSRATPPETGAPKDTNDDKESS